MKDQALKGLRLYFFVDFVVERREPLLAASTINGPERHRASLVNYGVICWMKPCGIGIQ
jgi:hypothetical protein